MKRNEVLQIGERKEYSRFKNQAPYRVFCPCGISPTVITPSGGGHTPQICANFEKMEVRDNYITCASRKRGDVHKIECGDVVANALTTINTDSMVKDQQNYRIRKLTERECFRLMDVEDADIDKIQASGVSKSQQYKMAGNSICVGVLYEIFRSAFVQPEKVSEPRQMELF